MNEGAKNNFKQINTMQKVIFEQQPGSTEEQSCLVLKNEKGAEVGQVIVRLNLTPVKYYYIQRFNLSQGFRKQNLGNLLVEKMNIFLKQRKRPGILCDGAFTTDEKTGEKIELKNFYLKHGWKYIGDNKYMIFNANEEEYKKLEKKYLVSK